MKLLFCGLGSIARRHIKNIVHLSGDYELLAYRSGFSDDTDFVQDYGIKTFTNYEEALDYNPDAVFLTNPTSLHLPMALKAAEKNCHLFIEKPISDTLDGVDKLIEIVDENELIGFVGCTLRFHPGLVLVKKMLTENRIGKIVSVRAQAGQYLPDWRPMQDYRKTYSADKDLDGGVILDLIHEIDYLYWIFGDVRDIFAFSDKLSNLEINTEDIAEILLKFRNNILAEVHLDYIQRVPIRTCQIIGQEGTIFWNYYDNTVEIFTTKNRRKISPKSKDFNSNQMYIDEIKHFINCVNGKAQPLVNIIDGMKVLKIALDAKKSSKIGKVITSNS